MEFFRNHKEAIPETSSEAVSGRDLTAFNFDYSRRNAYISQKLGAAPIARKTGTTICGVVFKGGIVLGADTRAAAGETVVEKDCIKIHYIAPNIYCCGAGTAADTEAVTQNLSAQLSLLRMQTHRPSRIVSAVTRLKQKLFRYQGHVSAALVLGGVDHTGSHLYTIYPHGSTDKLPFVTMGSGSLAAMAVFEEGYQDDMTEAQAMELVTRAVRAGIFNDTGSGSNVYLTVIRQQPAQAGQPATGVAEHFWPYQTPNDVNELYKSYERPKVRIIPKGSTQVVKESFEKFLTFEELEANARSATSSASAASESKMQLD